MSKNRSYVNGSGKYFASSIISSVSLSTVTYVCIEESNSRWDHYDVWTWIPGVSGVGPTAGRVSGVLVLMPELEFLMSQGLVLQRFTYPYLLYGLLKFLSYW